MKIKSDCCGGKWVVNKTPTPTQTPKQTVTPSITVTATPSSISGDTPTPTPSITATATPSSTSGDTPTPTPTIGSTQTPTRTTTNTNTPTKTIINTKTPTPSVTPSISLSPTVTPTITNTPTITVSISPTKSTTPSVTPTVTTTVTNTPTVTPTITSNFAQPINIKCITDMGKQWGITYNVRDYSVVYGLDSGAQWRNIASEEYPYSIVQTETTIKNSIDFEINEPLMIFVAQTTSSSDGITDNYILKQKTINKNNKNILVLDCIDKNKTQIEKSDKFNSKYAPANFNVLVYGSMCVVDWSYPIEAPSRFDTPNLYRLNMSSTNDLSKIKQIDSWLTGDFDLENSFIIKPGGGGLSVLTSFTVFCKRPDYNPKASFITVFADYNRPVDLNIQDPWDMNNNNGKIWPAGSYAIIWGDSSPYDTVSTIAPKLTTAPLTSYDGRIRMVWNGSSYRVAQMININGVCLDNDFNYYRIGMYKYNASTMEYDFYKAVKIRKTVLNQIYSYEFDNILNGLYKVYVFADYSVDDGAFGDNIDPFSITSTIASNVFIYSVI